MSELRALREIEGIWIRRLQQAEDDLREAQSQQRRAAQRLDDARLALSDYQKRLPGLIEQLYADCIGHQVSRQFVQDKSHDEGRLRAKVAEFRAEVTDAEKALQAAIAAVQQAQIVLNRQRVRLDAMRDLIKDERKKIEALESRSLAKALDELSGAKFVRAMRKRG